MFEVKIFCDGGLGNRLNSLVTGMFLSQKISRPWSVIWPMNNWCGASFHDLLEMPVQVHDWSVHDIFSEANLDLIISVANFNNCNLRNFQHPTPAAVVAAQNWPGGITWCHNKIPKWINKKDIDQSRPAIKARSDLLTEAQAFCLEHNIDGKVQGVHLRKTDFGFMQDESSLLRKISGSNQRFFICSDDANTEQKFATLPNVIIRPKVSYVTKLRPGAWNQAVIDSQSLPTNYNVNRNSDSVREALIDLVVLGRTHIVTKSTSTFQAWAPHFGQQRPNL